jgi:hypothetical protein
MEKGYKKLVEQLNSKPAEKPKRKYNKKPKNEAPVLENPTTELNYTPDSIEESVEHDVQILTQNLPEEKETHIKTDMICEDEAVLLLKAMYIRSKAGVSIAKSDLDTVIKILMA